jgi:hypothetical protein
MVVGLVPSDIANSGTGGWGKGISVLFNDAPLLLIWHSFTRHDWNTSALQCWNDTNVVGHSLSNPPPWRKVLRSWWSIRQWRYSPPFSLCMFLSWAGEVLEVVQNELLHALSTQQPKQYEILVLFGRHRGKMCKCGFNGIWGYILETIFWVMITCCLVRIWWRHGRTYCLSLWGGSAFLRNFCNFLSWYTASHHRRHSSS